MRQITQAFDRVIDAFGVLSGAVIVAIMLLICVEVIMRSVFGEPLTGVIDISGVLLVYMTFLGAAQLLKADGHVKMDWISSRLSPKQQSVLNFSTSILCSVVLFVVTWYAVRTTWNFYVDGYFMANSLRTPKFIVLSIVPVGFFLLLIQFLRKTFKFWKSMSCATANTDQEKGI